MGQPVFPVSFYSQAAFPVENLQVIQDILGQVFGPGGFPGMTENIAKQPDIVKSTRKLISDPNEIFQGCIVFMEVRKDQMPAVQRDRLSSAMEILR